MVRDNILKVRERIASVCAKVNRDPAEINIVAVSKGRTVEQIKEAIEAGITEIGENKVQEALVKYDSLQLKAYLPAGEAGSLKLKWHMVGHLQANKVKEAVRLFGLIHSVDTLHLAEEINRRAEKINKIQDIMVEVKTSPEATKSGFSPEEAIEALKEIAGLRNINIKGLMTIAPVVDDPEKTRPYFKTLRELRDEINKSLLNTQCSILNTLSMGMTDDFEVAIEEGSNMVRLGRAIFEG